MSMCHVRLLNSSSESPKRKCVQEQYWTDPDYCRVLRISGVLPVLHPDVHVAADGLGRWLMPQSYLRE